MQNHASYNILVSSSLVCPQTNCKAGELPLEDSVCLLYKFPYTAKGCVVSLPISYIFGDVGMSHQICLATYPESLSSNSSSWHKITWYQIKEINISYNMYWMHNLNIFSSCHNFINQIEEWLCFDFWGSKCMYVVHVSNVIK